MKSEVQSIVKLEMTGKEFNDLCELLNFGRYHLEDFIKELESEKKVDSGLVTGHKRLIEVSKQYTNLRAKIL